MPAAGCIRLRAFSLRGASSLETKLAGDFLADLLNGSLVIDPGLTGATDRLDEPARGQDAAHADHVLVERSGDAAACVELLCFRHD